MAVLISAFSTIVNLPMVWRDFHWDGATTFDNVSEYSLSSMTSEAKKFRRDNIYSKKRTNCDGYLLVFEHDNYEDKLNFEEKLLELDFEKHFHYASAASVWCDLIEVHVSDANNQFVLQAAKHGFDARLSLSLSLSQRAVYESVSVNSINLKQLVLSKEFIDYNLSMLHKKLYLKIKSLCQTKFSHTNLYAPSPYSHRAIRLQRLDVVGQVMPGIEFVVPEFELSSAKGFMFDPTYFKVEQK